MADNRSIELIFRMRTEGREQAEAALRSIKGLNAEVAKGSGELRAFDAANGKVVEKFGAMDGAAKQLMSTLSRSPQALGNLTSGTTAASEGLGGLVGSSGLAIAAIGTLATVAIGGATKLFALAAASGALAEQQLNMAARTGLTVKEVGLFTAVAEDAGLSAHAYTTAMRTLSQGLSENSDEGKKAKRALTELGITTHDQFGAVKATSDIFLQMSDRLGTLPDGANKSRLALEILGRGGLELLPALNGHLRDSVDLAQKMGVGFDDASAKSAAAFDDFVDRVKRGLKVIAADAGVVIAQLAGLDSRKPQTAAQYKRPLDAQGNFQLEINTRPSSLKTPDLNAFGLLRDKEKIFGLIHQEFDLTEKLSEAKKDLADADHRNDLQGVQVHLNAVKSLEAQKKALEDAKKSAAEWKQALKSALESIVQLETRAAGSGGGIRQKIEADRQGAVAKYGLTPEFKQRINQAYASLDFDADLKIVADARDKSIKSFEESGKHFKDIGKLHSEYYTHAFSEALKKDQDRLKAEIDILGKRLAQDDEFKTDTLSRRASASSRRFELIAGPTGAVSAIDNNTRIRLELAKQILDIESQAAERHATEDERQLAREKARYAYRKATEDASLDAETKLLELRQRSNEQYRESAGRVYDALRSGGTGGLRTLITGTADVQGRALFQNLSSKLLQTAGGTLGSIGAKSGLPGWLLRGTLADPQNAEIDKALALDKNTASLQDLTATIKGGPGASIGLSGIPGLAAGGVVPGFAGVAIDGSRTVASYFRGSGTNSKLGEFGFGASTAAGGLFAGFGSGQIKRGENGYVLTGSEKFGNVVGSAGIVAGATFGVIAGIKQGGARGALGAIGAGLGAAAAIPGPQQPYLAAAALVAALIPSLLPDPKKQREEEINRNVSSRRYEDTKGMERNSDLAGDDTGYDSRGRVRVINVVQNFNAIDAKSIIDRRQEFAAATAMALNEGGSDLGDSIRTQVSRY